MQGSGKREVLLDSYIVMEAQSRQGQGRAAPEIIARGYREDS